jgi:hypothetical protein
MYDLLTLGTGQNDILISLALRFAFNIAATFIIVVLLYARISRRKEFYFSYFAISIAVFLLVYLLQSVRIELGFALGLFAIFGIIRYRTDAIPPKEMTYLFIIIAVSVINALSRDYFNYGELAFINLLLVSALWALEKVLNMRKESSLVIVYEKIENMHKAKEAELLKDLEERTGVKIKRYQVVKLNYLRDIARIIVYFDTNGQSKREIRG